VWEINVSHARDPVHAGDKALTRETPAKRGIENIHAFPANIRFIWTSFRNSSK
jgi:hypothetical protein